MFSPFGEALSSGLGWVGKELGGLASSIGDLFGGLFDFLGNMLKDLFSFFKPLIDGVAWILEFLGGLISGIGNFIWGLFESAINGLVSGVKTIVGWIGSFFEFLGNLLKDLFVPKENYFSDEVGKLDETLNSKIDTKGLSNALESLKGANVKRMPTPRINMFGVNLEIDFMSVINENMGYIHMFIRAFMYVWMIRYNINNVYKLIRGSDLYGGGGD